MIVHLGNEKIEVEVALSDADLTFLMRVLSPDALFDDGARGRLDGENEPGR
ncbi:hypothetical protein [Actinomadura alba]|uniref:Uncharacterized protein n=1 Tax=Actinomadura alba TaxID=406431 RepID=A0ABR7LLJ7_9ACTN|nr:hypothetical protein [Actinomadura alba]MBC6465253.1 hypothetical protein [Actinomadura alba]